MSPRTIESTWQCAAQVINDHPIPVYLFLGGFAYLIWTAIYRLILYPRYFSPLRSVPGPSLGHPIYGRFGEIIRGEAGIPQRAWVKAFGPIVRVVGPLGIERLIFMRPEALQKILVSDWVEYPRPRFLREILGSVTGYGLLTVTGNEHRQMRKVMNPAFSIPNLMAQSDMYYEPIKSLIEIMNSQIKDATASDGGKVIHMYEWMSKVTLDIICETAFGYKTDSLHNPHNELAQAYENLVGLQTGPNIARLILIVSIPGATKFLQTEFAYRHRYWFTLFPALRILATMTECMWTIRKISAKMIEDKVKDSVTLSDSEAKRDIMSILMRARKADEDSKTDGYTMSDTAMMDQVLTFLGAGHETTASGLAWALWLLANDLESQDQLRKEVAPFFEEGSRPDYRTLKDLQWLDCVIQESLRVMPPVPMTFRQAAKTDYIDGVLVPKGTLFYIPIRVINTWKDLWGEDAEEFRPSRWLDLPPKYNSMFSTLSFLAGPHACIGKTMAIIEMKAVLAALITNFEFEPAYEGQIAHPTAAVTMKPADNMPLRVKPVKRK